MALAIQSSSVAVSFMLNSQRLMGQNENSDQAGPFLNTIIQICFIWHDSAETVAQVSHQFPQILKNLTEFAAVLGEEVKTFNACRSTMEQRKDFSPKSRVISSILRIIKQAIDVSTASSDAHSKRVIDDAREVAKAASELISSLYERKEEFGSRIKGFGAAIMSLCKSLRDFGNDLHEAYAEARQRSQNAVEMIAASTNRFMRAAQEALTAMEVSSSAEVVSAHQREFAEMTREMCSRLISAINCALPVVGSVEVPFPTHSDSDSLHSVHRKKLVSHSVVAADLILRARAAAVIKEIEDCLNGEIEDLQRKYHFAPKRETHSEGTIEKLQSVHPLHRSKDSTAPSPASPTGSNIDRGRPGSVWHSVKAPPHEDTTPIGLRPVSSVTPSSHLSGGGVTSCLSNLPPLSSEAEKSRPVVPAPMRNASPPPQSYSPRAGSPSGGLFVRALPSRDADKSPRPASRVTSGAAPQSAIVAAAEAKKHSKESISPQTTSPRSASPPPPLPPPLHSSPPRPPSGISGSSSVSSITSTSSPVVTSSIGSASLSSSQFLVGDSLPVVDLTGPLPPTLPPLSLSTRFPDSQEKETAIPTTAPFSLPGSNSNSSTVDWHEKFVALQYEVSEKNEEWAKKYAALAMAKATDNSMKEHIAKLEAENAALREELRLLREELTLGLLNLVAKLTPPTRSSPRQQSNP